MRCRKLNTDQEVELAVYANGIPCIEYVYPGDNSDISSISECYIAVKAGDAITVRGSFAGSVLRGAFDLIVDGSFLAESRTEGVRGQVKSFKNRRISFTKALHCPIPAGWTSNENPEEIFEGLMKVKPLSSEEMGQFSSLDCTNQDADPGVGSIMVVISATQQADEAYQNKYHDITSGRWRSRDPSSIRASRVAPEFEIEVEIPVGEEKIARRRSIKHRDHQTTDRFGSKPWGKIAFLYRTQDAIDKAGCVPVLDRVKDVDPDWSGSFKFGEDTTRSNWDLGQLDVSGDSQSDDSNSSSSSGLFVSSSPHKKAAKEADASTQTKIPPRLGGTLFLSGRSMQRNDSDPPEPSRLGDWRTPGFAGGLEQLGAARDMTSRVVFGKQAASDFNAPLDTSAQERLMGPPRFGTPTEGMFSFGIGERDSYIGRTRMMEMIGEEQTDQGSAAEFGPPSLPYLGPRDGLWSIADESASTRGFSSQVGANVASTVAHSQEWLPVGTEQEMDPDIQALPTMEEIRACFKPEGIPGFTLFRLFRDHGPYRNHLLAQEEFKRRYRSIAVIDSSKARWHLRNDETEESMGASAHGPSRTIRSAFRPPTIEGRGASGAENVRAAGAVSDDGMETDAASMRPEKRALAGSRGWPLAFRPNEQVISRAPRPAPSPAAAPTSRKRDAVSPLLARQTSKRAATRAADAVARAEAQLREKLALRNDVRKRIAEHNQERQERRRSKQAEAARRRLKELRREIAKVDDDLEVLMEEERLKESGQWEWDDGESVTSQEESAA